jgi:FixJ family two-component response regulator
MELLPELAVSHPEVAVVMLSGLDDLSVGVEAMRLGALDYVTKPVSMADLALRVEKALSQRELRLENVAYQELLETMLVALAEALEVQQGQLTALTKLLKTDIGQGSNLSPTSIRLHTARVGFERVLEKLDALAGMGNLWPPGDDGEGEEQAEPKG